MKSVTGYVVVALLLAGAGLVCWRLGADQRQVALVHQDLQTMEYAAANNIEVDGSLGPLARLPLAGGDMSSDARAGQSAAAYWLAEYDALTPSTETKQAETDSRLLLLSANAAYRAMQAGAVDRATALQRLDQVINGYRDVMRSNPDDNDAPYNYELVVRMRNELARQRGAASPKAAALEEPGTIHGRPGASPKAGNMGDFKVTIPQRDDERQEQRREQEDAGKGGQKQRKG